MIDHLIAYLNTHITALGHYEKMYGLVEQHHKEDKMFPGCEEQINIDNWQGVVYHRLRGPVTSEAMEDTPGVNTMLLRKTFPIRTVVAKQGTDSEGIETIIQRRINIRTLKNSLKAKSVAINVRSTDKDKHSVWNEEYDNIDFGVPTDYVYKAIEIDIVVEGTTACFELCEGTVPNYSDCPTLCEKIEEATGAQINDCLTEAQTAALQDLICEAGGSPVTVLDQDGNEVTTVECGGTYNVIVFSGIRDNGPPYTNSIIDNS